MLASHYRLSGTGNKREYEIKGFVKGFCEALVFGRILKPDQIDEIIHDEHLKIFGMIKEVRMCSENGHGLIGTGTPSISPEPKVKGRGEANLKRPPSLAFEPSGLKTWKQEFCCASEYWNYLNFRFVRAMFRQKSSNGDPRAAAK